MPIADVIRVSCTPCSYCAENPVLKYNKHDEVVSIQRGIIKYKTNKQTSGVSITDKKKKNVEEQPS